MNTSRPRYPRLHALLGDACRGLPEAVAETMEEALCGAAETTQPRAFFAFLEDIGKGYCADGAPWEELKLLPARALDMACTSQSASGTSAVLAVLHAAHVAREDDGPDGQLKADLVDGLFRACAALSRLTERSLLH